MKPLKPEVHEIPRSLVRAQERVQRAHRKIAALSKTTLRITRKGGRGWVMELSTTNLALEKAMVELRDAVSSLNFVAQVLRGDQ